MKQYWVTYQTAIALKKSGFPSPTPNSGQFWFSEHGLLTVFSEIDEYLVIQSGPSNLTTFIQKDNPPSGKDAFYAPTATEIINQMPDPELVSVSGGKIFVCVVKTDEDVKIYKDENSAEACAKAWLELHPIAE